MNLTLIYASVPRIACRGKCQSSCGPIAAHPREIEHFEATTGAKFPDAVKMLRSGRLDCPHLNAVGQCSVYQNRPLICRLWGVAEGMPCPWGCVPERVLPDAEAGELLRQTEC